MSRERQPDYKNAIAASGKDIYEPIDIGDADHWIPTQRLEKMLNDGLRGKSLAGLPLREREVLACMEVVGLDTAATARALGMTQVAVRVARHRGLKRLRERLDRPEGQTPPRVVTQA